LNGVKLDYENPCKPGEYKYIIVLLGTNARSTFGRLAHLLAHSGAVILLQQSVFRYHFSARLIPWVHYVPLSYNLADIVEKVEWLQKHDDLAHKIAINAKNFGKSHLRLEDYYYYCYGSYALKTISGLQSSDAKIPFNATNISKKKTFCR
jgi:hypothetical protein